MGILHIGIANGGYINVCEYVHDKWKNVVCTVMLVFDMLTVIITGIYWKWVSKNSDGILLFGIACNAIGLLGLLFIPETPEYLYSFYRFSECRDVIFTIAKWNRSELYKFIKEEGEL
jgi:ABC-type sugar transport system permease subunit